VLSVAAVVDQTDRLVAILAAAQVSTPWTRNWRHRACMPWPSSSSLAPTPKATDEEPADKDDDGQDDQVLNDQAHASCVDVHQRCHWSSRHSRRPPRSRRPRLWLGGWAPQIHTRRDGLQWQNCSKMEVVARPRGPAGRGRPALDRYGHLYPERQCEDHENRRESSTV